MTTLPSSRTARALVLCGALAVPALAAAARPEKGMLPSDDQECRDVPACGTTSGPLETVPAGQRVLFTYACPAERPHIWNWDTSHDKQVSVALVGLRATGLTLAVRNHAARPGRFVVYLGCSTAPYAGAGYMTSRAQRAAKRERSR